MAVESLLGLLTAVGIELIGAKLDRILTTRGQKAAFKKAWEGALEDLAESGYVPKGRGKIDASLILSTDAADELWKAFLDPTAGSKVDITRIAKELEGVYPGFKAGAEDKEALRKFVQSLRDRIRSSTALQPLVESKILLGLDATLGPEKEDSLVRAYLEREAAKVKKEMQTELGEGVEYIDPLIEKEATEKQPRGMDRSRPQDMERMPDEEEERAVQIDINDYFVNGDFRYAAIVADSGYGKTTLLRELFLRIRNAFDNQSRIPVLWPHGSGQTCTDASIRTILRQKLQIKGFKRAQIEQFVDEQYDAGNFVFLIDALDQMTDDHRRTFVACCGNDGFAPNRVIVTSRPNIWDAVCGHLKVFDCLEIKSFDEERWGRYLGADAMEKVKGVVDDEFLTVPILLKLVSEHYVGRGKDVEPPKNRADLYSRMFSDLLGRQEDMDAAGDATDPWYVHEDLKRLAHDTLAAGFPGQFTRDEAIKVLGEDKIKKLEKRRGLVTILEPGKQMAFRHRSFQEFLAAEYLNDSLESSGYDFDQLQSYLYHPHWEKSMQFLAGLLAGPQAETLVERIFNPPSDAALMLYRDHLRIAGICLREMGDFGKNHRARLVVQCENEFNDSILDKYAFRVMVETRLTDLTQWLLSLLATTEDYDIRLSAANALEAIKDVNAVPPLIDLLATTTSDDVRWRTAFALGAIKGARAVPPLIDLLAKTKSDAVRMCAADALGKIKDARAVQPLLDLLATTTSDHIRGSAVEALGEIKDTRAVSPLIDLLATTARSDVRRLSAKALEAIMNPSAVQPLINLLATTKSDDVRQRAASALGEIKDARAVQPLLDLLATTSSDAVRERAAFALEAIKDARAVQPLLNLLGTTKSDDVRWRTASALGEIKDARAVQPLLDLLATTSSDDVRARAADALGAIKDVRAVTPLIDLLAPTKSDAVRGRAALALGAIKDVRAVTPLIDLLAPTESAYVRARAADALGAIQDARAVPPLIDLLATSGNYDIWWRAADALGKIKDARAVPPLIDQLATTESESIRSDATEALEEIKDPSAVQPLIDLLATTKSDDTQWWVADALGLIEDARAVPPLIDLLATTKSDDVRERAAFALELIKDARAVEPLIALLAGTKSDVVRRTAAYALRTLAEMSAEDDRDTVIDAFRRCQRIENQQELLSVVESFDKAIRRKEQVMPFRH